MAQTAADILIDVLQEWGVDTVFGLPGDGINGIMESHRKKRDVIRFVQVRHEEAAAFMACRYAKFTGDAQILDAGCCGMAGAFGFDKQHYRISLDIGERMLLPAVRQAGDDTIVVADGFSCREQIRQTTGRRACHFAEIVWRELEEHHEDSLAART